MFTIKKIDRILNIVLLFGLLTSLGLVIIGGLIYLYQDGNQLINLPTVQIDQASVSWRKMLSTALFSPLGIIEFGLIILVATQLLRIALLTFFYMVMQDHWFIFFSVIILGMLIYSLLLR